MRPKREPSAPGAHTMRVVMTLLVRNEEDILDYHLRYHVSQGIDFFIVTDNRSEDATPAILERYRRKGILYVINQQDDNYAQSRWVTHMARLASNALEADWVIHSDADEFFYAERGTVRDALAAVPPEFGIVAIPRLNFVARPTTDEPFYERMQIRAAQALTHSRRKVCHRAHPRAVVTMGNHRVKRTRLRELPAEPIVLFHYPHRSYAQFERKVRLGGGAVTRNPALGADQGTHWRQWYVLLHRGVLRPYYEAHEIDEKRAVEGLRRGDLVVDRRLARRLVELPAAVEDVRFAASQDTLAELDERSRADTRLQRARDRAAAVFWGVVGRSPALRSSLTRLKRAGPRLKASAQRVAARR